MKQSVVQIKFDSNKYNALLRYAGKKDVSVESELKDTLDKLYKKLVPADVREFIEEREEYVKMKPSTKKQNNGGESKENCPDEADGRDMDCAVKA